MKKQSQKHKNASEALQAVFPGQHMPEYLEKLDTLFDMFTANDSHIFDARIGSMEG